jgi:hypothetical protein
VSLNGLQFYIEGEEHRIASGDYTGIKRRPLEMVFLEADLTLD